MKPDEIDFQLSDLLARWHAHSCGHKYTRGYAGADATCKDHRTAGLYDRENGALDARLESSTMKEVGSAIDSIPNDPMPWNTALHIHARNLHTGNEVWRSARLPQSKAERDVILLEARNMLIVKLMRRGVMS